MLRKNGMNLRRAQSVAGPLEESHPAKLQLARRLRQETTRSLKWIADRLLDRLKDLEDVHPGCNS
jgi:hypothetical protein